MRHAALWTPWRWAPPAGAFALAALVALGCKKNDPGQLLGSDTTGTPCMGAGGAASTATAAATGAGGAGSTTAATTTATTGAGGAGGSMHTVLDDRKLSYTEALRTASFKLVGNAPTMQQIEDLRTAADPKAKYAEMVDAMMADVRFSKRMIAFWQNTMRMGGSAGGGKPSRDTAPTFAARITVEGQAYTNLFTATSNTCPTFDGTKFVDGDCKNGPVTAGILADPGIHSQYYGNLAFRRVRFFQETFVCRKQPAELSTMPKPIGMNGQSYTSPWDFASIAGADNGGRVDFHDVSSAICANCHTSSNHRAPLFANFDDKGAYQDTIQVQVPVTGLPNAVMGDWLPPGEGTAWKFGVPAADLTAMGAAMAADDEVLSCAVSRVWNYAMSKGDIVIDAASVPTEVIAPLFKQFKMSGYNLNAVLRSAFVSDDFVRF